MDISSVSALAVIGPEKPAPGDLDLVRLFVNTSYGQGQRLRREIEAASDLRGWLVDHDLLDRDAAVSDGDVRRALALREDLRALMIAHTGGAAPTAGTVESLNRIAAHAPLVARFGPDGLADLTPDIAGVDGALAKLVGLVLRSMLDGTWGRMKACAHVPCGRVFYDTSKNGSGKWCAMAKCGNRLNAREYRRRKREEPEPD